MPLRSLSPVNSLRITLVAVALMALSACSSVVTQRDYDPTRDFAAYHRWQWATPHVVFTPDNTLARSSLTAERINQALNEQLPGKGLMPANTAQGADVLLQATVAYTQRIQEDPFYDGPWGPWGPRGYYGRPYGWGGPSFYAPRVRSFPVTILQLDMYDRHDGQLVWRGRVARDSNDGASPQQRAQIIAGLVEEALKQYPPAP
ncbi:DUF4136 domain-containing protein [Carnimonas nigrificans]|uniref:DUF4136 domain-containing protein n=1 Tax=Carnimonas nigrificans TaxID=64323 RepID=UPI000688F7B2|nr:DUF4136 domain-containing protein [Carnimonas nigrificans]